MAGERLPRCSALDGCSCQVDRAGCSEDTWRVIRQGQRSEMVWEKTEKRALTMKLKPSRFVQSKQDEPFNIMAGADKVLRCCLG